MSEGLNEAPEQRPGEKKYEVVRRAAGMSPERLPDELIHSIFAYAGDQVETPYELAVFVQQALKYDLSPVSGEIFAFRTQGKLRVWAGRDGFIKAAERSPNYEGHQVGVVFENDDFSITVKGDDVEVRHEIAGIDRGRPVGGYAVGWGRNRKPVVLTRKWSDWEHLWSDSRKWNWKKDPIGMAENRLIRAVLTRIVPLGGLGIEGDQEDHLEDWMAKQMGRSTRTKLDDIRSELGLDADEIEVTEDPNAGQDLISTFRQVMDQHGIRPEHIESWAFQHASFPSQPEDWQESHFVEALKELRDTGGRDFVQEYIRELAGKADIGIEERQELEDKLTDLAVDTPQLLRMAERLEERVAMP